MRVLALLLFLSSTTFAMEGMYYCQDTASGGIHSGSGTNFKESKFTVKVKPEEFTVVSGVFGTAYLNPVTISDKDGWLYATGGIYQFLTLRQQGSVYSFTLLLSAPEEQTYSIAIGHCQKW